MWEKGVVVTLKFKKSQIIIISLLTVIILGTIGFQVVNKTTFGNVLDQNMSEKDEISHIIIQSKIEITGNYLWARIEDPQVIDQLLTESAKVSLKRQFRKSTRILNHTMTISTGAHSYFIDFDDDYFVANGKDYKIENGNFISIIRSLEEHIEWETDEGSWGI